MSLKYKLFCIYADIRYDYYIKTGQEFIMKKFLSLVFSLLLLFASSCAHLCDCEQAQCSDDEITRAPAAISDTGTVAAPDDEEEEEEEKPLGQEYMLQKKERTTTH